MITLKALELFGFKSFADRTRFEFPEGITVVVGPNGSGKSNVVDAIKWVLGEQSVRNLRGKASTDVIFAGSTARKALNAAEVSLVFDNTTRELPVESDEVRIMRRVYRSGESEYLVNDGISRLRDIREILSGTGAATDAYSVIEQGRVDALLVASGKERRAVFEEAAGITKFRARRAEAMRRLDRTEQNRQRLADIVGEVAARLETVKKQASRARRWKRMTEKLQSLRFAAASADLVGANNLLEEVLLSTQEAKVRSEAAQAEKLSAEETLKNLGEEQKKIEPELASVQEELAADRENVVAVEAKREALRGRCVDVEGELESAVSIVCFNKAQLQSTSEAIRAVQADCDSASNDLRRVECDLREQEEAIVGSREDAQSAQKRLSELRETKEQQSLARQKVEAVVVQRREEAKAALDAVERCQRGLDKSWALVHRLEEGTASLEGTVDVLAQRRIELQSRHEQLDAEQLSATHRVELAWQNLAERQGRLEVLRDRQKLLEDLIASHEGVSEATRQVLDQFSDEIPGLRGLPSDLIVADSQWAGLVDIAVGVLGQRIVVDRLSDILDWCDGWNRSFSTQELITASGRVGFLAIDKLPEPPSLEIQEIFGDGGVGVIGRLDRLVSGESKEARETEVGRSLVISGEYGSAESIDKIVEKRDHADASNLLRRRLLGRIWIVESVELACRVVDQMPPGLVFLSQEGSWLSSDGGFEVGASSAGVGLVSRHSELRAVKTEQHAIVVSVREAKGELHSCQQKLEGFREEQKRLVAKQHELAESIASSRSEQQRFQRELLAARSQVDEQQQELHGAESRAVAVADAVRAVTTDSGRLTAEISGTDKALEDVESNLKTLGQSHEQVLERIAGLRDQLSVCRERVAGLEATIIAKQADKSRQEVESLAAVEKENAIRKRLTVVTLEVLRAGDRYAEASLLAECSARRVAVIVGQQLSIRTNEKKAIRIIDCARETLQECSSMSHAADLKKETAMHQRTRVLERLHDDYGIDPMADLPSPAKVDSEGNVIEIPEDREELDSQIEDARRKVGAVGSVNLEALAESEELAERLAGLESQLIDVTDGKHSVEKLIARIDEESRRLLGETIEKVRAEFSVLFERLFGGGQADIILDPEIDLLDTTVEIVARPPGKEPRNISLLSGGEKTMTCVALLLSIFRSRPSPFCVLDEVDAALDEANVDRFVGVLRDFLSSTQFIVVTHSKKTMATATTLYGVTMEESGVSKRVAVQFESNASALQTKAA
jgi:chromosome segregation protein